MNMTESILTVTNKYSADADIVLECNDAVEFARKLQDESVQLIVASPPYNIVFSRKRLYAGNICL